MNWYSWTLIGLWALSALATVGRVGKPRKPLSPSDAVVTIIMAALLIGGLLAFGLR